MTHDVWIVVNAVAGGGRGVSSAEVCRQALSLAGMTVRVVSPGSAVGTRAAARAAVADGARVVIACGGDGTVHDVLQELVEGGPALGILPSGSGDDIADSLGFCAGPESERAPGLVRSCASVVADATAARHVDLGRVVASDGSERAFLGVLSTGFDSAVNERANAMSRLGGQRYLVALVRELASFRPADYRLDVDGLVTTGPAMLVAVGNGATYGGGMRVCPDAQPDDGLLDITWLSAVPKATFLRAFPSVYRGTHIRRPYVRTFRGARLSIAAAGQMAYADGERVGPLPVDVTVAAGALRVLPVGRAVA